MYKPIQNKMTKEELRSRYNSYISHETIGNNEYNILLEWLKQNDGKAINRRLKLPENFILDFRHGMFHMINTSTQFSHLIGYNSNPVIDSKKFVDYDACYGYASLERIEKCKFILANQIDLLLNQYNEMHENWNNFFTTQQGMYKDKILGWVNNPIYHDLMKSFLPEQIYRAL